MKLFNSSSKSDFNKEEAKREISSLAKKANEIIKTNQLLQNEYGFWAIYADLLKELLRRYMTSSNNEITIDIITKHLIEAQAKLKDTSDRLKQDIESIQLKLDQSFIKVEDATASLNVELERKREELFFSENKVVFRQFQVEKTRKEIEKVNIVQELERDVYIAEFEKANNVFSNENAKHQERLLEVSKELNSEKLRRSELYKTYCSLKRELKNQASSKTKAIKEKSGKEKEVKQWLNNNMNQNNGNNQDEDDLDMSLDERARDLENLSFNEFSEEKSFDKDETLFFPDRVNQLKEVPKLLLNIQLPDVSGNQPVPKLDLKQIEFNKSKVKNQMINIYSNNLNINEEMENNPEPNNKYGNSNSKNNNQNKNTKSNTYSTTQKDNQIEQLLLDICALKEKMKSNRQKIRKFKQFHKVMSRKYLQLQEKYAEEQSILKEHSNNQPFIPNSDKNRVSNKVQGIEILLDSLK